jgi:hypothetical protein
MAAAKKEGARIRQQIYISKPVFDQAFLCMITRPAYPITSARAPRLMMLA